MLEKLTKEQFAEIMANAENFIKPGELNDWIGTSALIRRSYYWGLINGLESLLSTEDLNQLSLKMIQSTMFASEVDKKIQAEIMTRK